MTRDDPTIMDIPILRSMGLPRLPAADLFASRVVHDVALDR